VLRERVQRDEGRHGGLRTCWGMAQLGQVHAVHCPSPMSSASTAWPRMSSSKTSWTKQAHPQGPRRRTPSRGGCATAHGDPCLRKSARVHSRPGRRLHVRSRRFVREAGGISAGTTPRPRLPRGPSCRRAVTAPDRHSHAGSARLCQGAAAVMTIRGVGRLPSEVAEHTTLAAGDHGTGT
jgi:hypothetical protein